MCSSDLLGINAPQAEAQARSLALRLLPAERMDAFPAQLTRAEQFAALLLRAMAIPGQVIVIESPLASFRISEAYLRDCVARCHGLFSRVAAHELRTSTMETV